MLAGMGARVSTSVMRAMVRQAASEATAAGGGTTIADVLATKSIALAGKIEDGSGGTVAGVTGNGTSVAYAGVSANERVSITAQIEAIETLIELHGRVTVAPYVVSTVETAMLAQLVACRSYRTNFHQRAY